MKNYLPNGTHCICDLHNISNGLLDDSDFLEQIMRKACELSGATVLSSNTNKFEPAGCTITLNLSESHASIHTYVNLKNRDGLGECFIDIFSCGNCSPIIGITYIINQLCTDESIVNIKTLKRGQKGGIADLSEMCEIMCN